MSSVLAFTGEILDQFAFDGFDSMLDVLKALSDYKIDRNVFDTLTVCPHPFVKTVSMLKALSVNTRPEEVGIRRCDYRLRR